MAGMQVLGTTCEPFFIFLDLSLSRSTEQEKDIFILVEADWLMNHLRR